MKEMIIAYLVARAKEASTWRGLISIITGAGIAINPPAAAAIVAIGLAVGGSVGAFFPDGKE